MSNNKKLMFVFPGQGSQYKGIGSDLYQQYASARSIYQQANEVLGFDIAELSFTGAEEKITLTRYTQPILLTHAVACLTVLQELLGEAPIPVMTAGHSLGEYSALVAAGALSFEQALGLVQKRGEYMGEYGDGEMMALTVDVDTARPLTEKHYCALAGLNLADQTVVGGRGEDLDALAAELNERFPRKRAIRLKTEGAFHTYYMVTAAQHYRSVLDDADIVTDNNAVKVLSNYTGAYHDADADVIKTNLFYQLFYPVRWLDNLTTAFADGVDLIIEFGGGIGKGETPAEKRPNLETMIKKAQRGTDFEVDYLAAINIASIEQTAEQLQQG